MPTGLRELRIAGESGSFETAIFITDRQAAAPSRFRLSYLSALSVLPEASSLVIAVNDKVVGSTSINRPGRADAAEFDIPAGLLVHGLNAVRISVDQRHRADCSVGATYELWTVIDRAQSGFIFAGADANSTVDRLDELPALAVRADGAMPIRIVHGGKMSRELTEQLIATVQRITLLNRGQQPAIDFGAMLDDGDGINLVVGTRDELPALLGAAAPSDLGSRNVWFVPDRSGKRPSLVVTGASPSELTQSLATLRSEAVPEKPPGSAAGLLAAARLAGYRASGREEILTLGSLGLSEAPFSGHFYRFDFELQMPADFLPVDYDRVTLDLSGSYGEGLTPDAHIAIEVNGSNAATATLPRRSGGRFELNQIFFPLSRLRPGANRLSIVARLPRASDQSCDTNLAAPGDMRFLLSGSSRIILPNIARIGRAPDLALTLNSGVAPAISDPSPMLYVPAPDSQSMSAALTLAARLAAARNKVIDFHFTVTPPPAGNSNVLLVAPANRLDPARMRSVGLDPDQIRLAWDDVASRPERQPGSRAVALAPAESADGADNGCLAKAGDGVIADPRKLMASASDNTGSIPQVAPQGEHAGSLIGALRGLGHDWSGNQPHRLAVDADTLLLVAEGRDADTGSEWTIVTAASPSLLRKTVECVVAPRRWRMLRGRQAAVDVAGDIRTVEAEQVRYLSTQALSFTNARLVFAGWLSLNSATYIATMLLLAGCLGGATSTLLSRVGRRQQ